MSFQVNATDVFNMIMSHHKIHVDKIDDIINSYYLLENNNRIGVVYKDGIMEGYLSPYIPYNEITSTMMQNCVAEIQKNLKCD